jgi:hypothetical protein
MGNTISGGCGSHRPVPPNYASIPVGRPVVPPEKTPVPPTPPATSTGPSLIPAASSPETHRPADRISPDLPRDPGIAELEKWKKEGLRSQFNGFKRMSPHVQEAVRQLEYLFPPNIQGKLGNRCEHGTVFHEIGPSRLISGEQKVGILNSVHVPKDIRYSSARVNVHSHPYTEEPYFNFEPSIGDHLVARQFPGVEHVIQAPQFLGANQYITYSGATPPRYYFLVPNPDNHPVPRPDSPDGRMPPFRPRPEAEG